MLNRGGLKNLTQVRILSPPFMKFQKSGFTLIELLVSLFIVVTISSLALVNYQGTQKEGALLRSAQKLAQDLRRAQNMATSTIAIGGQIRDYYGVNLIAGAQNYTLYIDLNGDQLFTSDEIIETASLETNIKILSFSGASPANINFKSPFGETSLAADFTIILSFLDESKTKNVIIRPSGQIELP